MMGIRGKGSGRKAAPPKSEIPALKVKLRGKDILYDGADTALCLTLIAFAIRRCGAGPCGRYRPVALGETAGVS